MTTHAPTITTPLPPRTTSKPQQSQRTKHHHDLNVIVVLDTRIHRTHNLVATRRSRLNNRLIHIRARRRRVHNPHRDTRACTVESCLITVPLNCRLRATLTEGLSDSQPRHVALTLNGGDGLRARPGVHLEHVPAIPLTGHLTTHVSARRQAIRRSWLNRTNPQPSRKRDLTGVTPPQVGHAPILLNDERTTRTVPHSAGIPQARPVLLILRLTRGSLRHVNGGASLSEHPPTSRGSILGRIRGHTTHQAHNPKHQGHHHAHRLSSHRSFPFDPPHRRGRVADDPNHTPTHRAHVNPQPTTRNVTYIIEHAYTQPPTHTHVRTTNTQPSNHTNTSSHKHAQHARPAQTPKITTTK